MVDDRGYTRVEDGENAESERSKKRKGGNNGFKALGLSDAMYHNITRMGFKVRRAGGVLSTSRKNS